MILINKLIFFLTGVMFFLFPWYLQGSGLYQPVDVIILLFFGLFFLLQFPYLSMMIRSSSIYRIFLTFSAYIICSLFIHYLVLMDEVTAKLIVQNVYCTIILTVFIMLIAFLYCKSDPKKFYHSMLIFLLLEAALPLLVFFKTHSFNDRIALTFNNANQLGFFSLVNLSICFYMMLFANRENIPIHKKLSFLIININLLFLFLSSSRACYPGIAIYVISYFLMFRVKTTGYKFWLFLTLSAASVLVFMGYLVFALSHYMQQSRRSMTTSSDGVLSDIYFRMFHGLSDNFVNIWYFLFGTGTYSNMSRGSLEFHNNLLGIFNQTGFLGALFYIYMNVIILRELYKISLLHVLPYACYIYYSIFHYCYRTRINWLFLAIVIFILWTANRVGYKKNVSKI